MSKISAAKLFLWIFLLLPGLASKPALAAPKEIEGAVFSWTNMSLMGPGDESAHYISVTRASDVMQHGINYHEGKIIQKLVLYRTDDAARLHLLDALGDAVESWLPDYNGHILDGSSWSLVVHYAGYKESKMFKGYGQTPPRADKIKRLILNLAEFETTPEIF